VKLLTYKAHQSGVNVLRVCKTENSKNCYSLISGGDDQTITIASFDNNWKQMSLISFQAQNTAVTGT
jgi:hypothetical protein